MKTLKERTQHAIDEGFTVGEMAKATGKTSSAVSQWKSGGTKDLKADSATGLEQLTGWHAQWWATGKGPRGETKRGASVYVARENVKPYQAVAQPVSPVPRTVANLISWEAMVQGDYEEEFTVALPDDSMAPRGPAGTRLIFRKTDAEKSAPLFGAWVVVRNTDGDCFVRQCRESDMDAWEAHPFNDGYRTMLPSRDGLQIIAVMIGVMRSQL